MTARLRSSTSSATARSRRNRQTATASTRTPTPPHGVDFEGRKDEHSLLPRGWQRSGALAALFRPSSAVADATAPPRTLLAPSYGDLESTIAHRTCQTIQGLADHLESADRYPV